MNTRDFVENQLSYPEKLRIICNSNDPVLNNEEDLIVHIEENPEEYQDLFDKYNVMFD